MRACVRERVRKRVCVCVSVLACVRVHACAFMCVHAHERAFVRASQLQQSRATRCASSWCVCKG